MYTCIEISIYIDLSADVNSQGPVGIAPHPGDWLPGPRASWQCDGLSLSHPGHCGISSLPGKTLLLPCHHPTAWVPFPQGAALTLATLTTTFMVWYYFFERKNFFSSGDVGRVWGSSFLTYKSSVEEQQESGSGWDVQRSLAAGKHSGVLSLPAAFKPNT